MDAQDWLALLAILICLALSFFFSGSETALTAFSRARMMRMEKAGNPRAAIVNRLLQARERLIGGILLGNVWSRLAPKLNWPGSDECLTLFSYVCLGLFYSMTLMSLQLWAAGEFLAFIVVSAMVQVALSVGYAWLVVFRLMGRDYEAAVFAAGFTGISLGTTATTMAIITAVARQYGSAHRAFVVIPVACGVFIDITNSLVIRLFTWL